MALNHKSNHFPTCVPAESEVINVDTEDELEVYGVSENPTGTTITSYMFEVRSV